VFSFKAFDFLLVEEGFVDAYRFLQKQLTKTAPDLLPPDDSTNVVASPQTDFTYWSHRFRAKELNRGWRIDYFVVSQEISTAGS